ncbi:MAG: condensation domain-containing protein, partial [Bryobacteraceae bacterium]
MNSVEITVDQPDALAHDAPPKTASAASGEEELFALPLSLAQERMFAADRQCPGNAAYNASFRLRLEGPLDAALFDKVIGEIVRRHEILRTTFISSGGQAVQLIRPWVDVPVTVEDLRGLPASGRQAVMERLCGEEARQPFDLSTGPLIRVRLLQLDEDDYVLTLTLHHIVCDGWSIGILLSEIENIYRAYAAGKPSPLSEPSIQYADYVLWQKDWLETADLIGQIVYW